MSREASPNQLRLAWESLKELEQLEETVSFPLTGVMGQFRFKARALLGMLLLYLISPSLRLDFRTIMTLGGITREGKFDKRRVRKLPDADQPKRKVLRNIIVNLENANMLETEQVVYEDPRTIPNPRRVLERIPEEGTVCWAGEVLFLQTRPSGLRTSVHALKVPQVKIVNWQLFRDELSDRVDSSTIEFCKRELKSVYSSLLDLFQKNKIDARGGKDLTMPQFDERQIVRVIYFLGALEKPRGLTKKLHAVLPVLGV